MQTRIIIIKFDEINRDNENWLKINKDNESKIVKLCCETKMYLLKENKTFKNY